MDHILHCYHRIVNNQETYNNQRIITLKCQNKIAKKYKGQISLYPPDQLPPNHSVSTGVISLYGGKDPYFFPKDETLTSNAADTFCRQMGFSKHIPNSIMSISEAGQLGYTFDDFLSDV